MVTRAIDIHELQRNLDALLSEVNAGTEIVVMDANRPVARLLPPHPEKQRQPGLHPEAIQMADDFDTPLPENFWLGDS
ncbi:MAG: type II toxin-antitoxin system prevent-host-death family antitoxin [Anaerolineae bacterium]|nr:type II toxin-antitoxin system prevent-host-death family antitoxin [Anaerolineae bacterium]